MVNREHNEAPQLRSFSKPSPRSAKLAAAVVCVLGAAVGLLVIGGDNSGEAAASGVSGTALRTELLLPVSAEEEFVAMEDRASSAPRVTEAEPVAISGGGSAEETALAVAGLADDWLYATPEDFERSMKAVFAPAHHDELRTMVLTQGVGLMRTALATAPTQEATWYFTQPLSAAVLQGTDDESVVQVWEVSVFSREGVSEPTSSWTLHDVELVKIDGQWLVSDWQSKPGPVPRTHRRSEPSSAEVLTAKLFNHHRVDRADFTNVTMIEEG